MVWRETKEQEEMGRGLWRDFEAASHWIAVQKATFSPEAQREGSKHCCFVALCICVRVGSQGKPTEVRSMEQWLKRGTTPVLLTRTTSNAKHIDLQAKQPSVVRTVGTEFVEADVKSLPYYLKHLPYILLRGSQGSRPSCEAWR